MQCIGTGWVTDPDFLGKSGYSGDCSAIVMAKRVKDIECVLGLLAIIEGAEFER